MMTHFIFEPKWYFSKCLLKQLFTDKSDFLFLVIHTTCSCTIYIGSLIFAVMQPELHSGGNFFGRIVCSCLRVTGSSDGVPVGQDYQPGVQ